jgi:hypothetical protein
VGSVRVARRRFPHHQPIATFTIASNRAHRAVTIPFATTLLPACAKRTQFERWRSHLATYEAAASQAALRRRGDVRGAGVARSRRAGHPVHGRAPGPVVQARPVPALARGPARLLGASGAKTSEAGIPPTPSASYRMGACPSTPLTRSSPVWRVPS